jgi:hypothetical protein
MSFRTLAAGAVVMLKEGREVCVFVFVLIGRGRLFGSVLRVGVLRKRKKWRRIVGWRVV